MLKQWTLVMLVPQVETGVSKLPLKKVSSRIWLRKLLNLLRPRKLKVQAAIQGEQVRVTGKKRDDLQAVMQLIRTAELEQSFQFNNFKD